MDNLFIWLIVGILVVCCVVPMLFMGKHGDKNKGGRSEDDSGKP